MHDFCYVLLRKLMTLDNRINTEDGGDRVAGTEVGR